MEKVLRLMLTVIGLMLCADRLHSDNIPQIGAQVFVEPGQSDQDIEDYFAILKKCGMRVARIRMFGAHILDEDGSYDFSLYDKAFKAAQENGVKLFVTLFPPTDLLTDIGGFKFPSSLEHLDEIGNYIDAVVSHYAAHPALHTWVLQNEPGNGGTGPAESDWERQQFEVWESLQEKQEPGSGNEYLKADFSKDRFHNYCLTSYLKWIADRVRQNDTRHYLHVNPHQLLDHLHEYDFQDYGNFLNSLGVSMHMSWHFGYFSRCQYPLGVSIMSDIIRSAAGTNPFWITELQGGNVTASGNELVCPTAEEIRQWLWTGISAGADGVIFWTLNPRKAVMEAGEWGLLDFQNMPSDRLEAASGVSRSISDNSSFFSEAKPHKNNIVILYNRESLFAQRLNAETVVDNENEGRMASSVMKSVCSAYQAISYNGVIPDICDMASYDWENADHDCIILPNIISLPSYYWDRIDRYVKGGGKLIVTGMTGYYDEYMRCNHMGGFPLEKTFGARIREYKVKDKYFDVKMDNGIVLPAHLWSCSMVLDGAKPICADKGNVMGTVNTYGQGKVIWLPMLIDLGARQKGYEGLSRFYRTACLEEIESSPVFFAKPVDNVLMRIMETEEEIMVLVINKNLEQVEIELGGMLRLKGYRSLADEVKMRSDRLQIEPEGCCVMIWDKNRIVK